MASYMANAAAARDLGYEDIASVCETIIMEEQDMADWLEMQLPLITCQHMLTRVEAD